MKAVLPWQHKDYTGSGHTTTTSGHTTTTFCLLNISTRYHIDGRNAAVISTLQNKDEIFYDVCIFECIVEKIIRKKFGTFEEAISFVEDVITKNNVKRLPDYMLVLK